MKVLLIAMLILSVLAVGVNAQSACDLESAQSSPYCQSLCEIPSYAADHDYCINVLCNIPSYSISHPECRTGSTDQTTEVQLSLHSFFPQHPVEGDLVVNNIVIKNVGDYPTQDMQFFENFVEPDQVPSHLRSLQPGEEIRFLKSQWRAIEGTHSFTWKVTGSNFDSKSVSRVVHVDPKIIVGDCSNPSYAVANENECLSELCKIPSYNIAHPECKTSSCDDPAYAASHPECNEASPEPDFDISVDFHQPTWPGDTVVFRYSIKNTGADATAVTWWFINGVSNMTAVPIKYAGNGHVTEVVRGWKAAEGTTNFELRLTGPFGTESFTHSVTVDPPYCSSESWEYGPWSECSAAGTQSRSPVLVDHSCRDPIANKPVTQTRSCTPPPQQCTSSAWGFGSWSSCSSSGTQSRSPILIDTSCSNAQAVKPATQTRSCTPPTPQCTSSAWSFSAWSACSASGSQSRSPVLVDHSCQNPNAVKPATQTRSCTPPPVQCTASAWSCGSFGECTDGLQTRTCDLIDHTCENPLNVMPVLEQSCSVDPVECTEAAWDPGSFGACVEGIQTRTPTLLDTTCSNPEAVKPTTTQVCTVDPLDCTVDAWSCSDYGSCSESGVQTRTCDLIDTTCNNPSAVKPTETQSCTPPDAIAPSIDSFTINPDVSDAGEDVTIHVSATDNSNNLDRIEVSLDGNVIASQDCSGSTCELDTTYELPNLFDKVLTFIAKVFDTAENSDDETATVTTNPAEPLPPEEPKFKPLEIDTIDRKDVNINVPLNGILAASVIPEQDCVLTGTDAWIYTSLNNRGDFTLKDMTVMMTIPELGVYARDGPFRMKPGDKETRLLPLYIEPDAEEGWYYIKYVVSSDKDRVVKYRDIKVSNQC